MGLFADGAAVKTIGAETFRICNELVDDMVTVSTDEICAAIKLGFMDTRCVLEPAGRSAPPPPHHHPSESESEAESGQEPSS